jgi:hypothetical protein
VKKRRRNHYGWLTEPRAEMKRKMAKGVILKLLQFFLLFLVIGASAYPQLLVQGP